MVRERLLATLSVFFASVALLLAGIGLFGVLNAAVQRQHREIGIRMALGAGAAHVVRSVTIRMFAVLCAGAVVGLGAGMAFGRVVQTLLYQVTPTDAASLLVPLAMLVAVAVLAALPATLRAVRINPASTLKTE